MLAQDQGGQQRLALNRHMGLTCKLAILHCKLPQMDSCAENSNMMEGCECARHLVTAVWRPAAVLGEI